MKKAVRDQTTCPIAYTANIIGDPWSLLIARDIVFYGKRTYGEFLSSNEGVTTSMLADKLVNLEIQGLLTKAADTIDKRKVIYSLTNKGLDLFIPLLVEMANWGVAYNPLIISNSAWVKQAAIDKNKLVVLVRQTVVKGGSVLNGGDSVMKQLERG
ncbi:MAG TPA: helix-turn-helix domain-containing protein [Candidatus Chromulinivoraceae bacterium]|nr:helix-turn-helix domain-containing protein [Candidatus Chromulinivoraceae bacterium]